MGWKTNLIMRINRKERLIEKYDSRRENAIANGDEASARIFEKRSDLAFEFVEGMETAIQEIGYTIVRDGSGAVSQIEGYTRNRYRVRYTIPTGRLNAIICLNHEEVQAVIDRIKSFTSGGYKFVGLDEMTILPDGEFDPINGWSKVFDM